MASMATVVNDKQVCKCQTYPQSLVCFPCCVQDQHGACLDEHFDDWKLVIRDPPQNCWCVRYCFVCDIVRQLATLRLTDVTVKQLATIRLITQRPAIRRFWNACFPRLTKTTVFTSLLYICFGVFFTVYGNCVHKCRHIKLLPCKFGLGWLFLMYFKPVIHSIKNLWLWKSLYNIETPITSLEASGQAGRLHVRIQATLFVSMRFSSRNVHPVALYG